MRIRVARGALLGLLVGLAVLSAGPLDLGAIRIGGVSLLWWYAGVAGPLGAVVVTLAVLVRRADRTTGERGGGPEAARAPDRRLLRVLRGVLRREPVSKQRRVDGAR